MSPKAERLISHLVFGTYSFIVKVPRPGDSEGTFCPCVCSIRLLPRDESLLFQNRNRRDMLNTRQLTRITAHKQSKRWFRVKLPSATISLTTRM